MRERILLAWAVVLTGAWTLSVAGVAVGAGPSAGGAGEEVMRPTKYGLVASPEWLTPLMGVLVEESEWEHGADLTADEKQQLAESMSRHGMELARTHGREMQDFLQFGFEAAFEHNGPRNFDAATGQEFARRFLPVSGPLKAYFDGVIRDSRDFLRPPEAADIERWLGRMGKAVDGLEKGMNRWAQGDVDERGNPFRVPEVVEQLERSEEERKELDRKRTMRRMRSRTQRELSELSPDAWPEFVRTCDFYFGFDAGQKKRAEALRLEFLAQAQSVMGGDWRSKVGDNRTRYYLLSESQGDAVEPWLFRLDQECRTLVRPVEEVNHAFRDAVIALATSEQRQSALARTAEAAARHGLSARELGPIRALLSEATTEKTQ